MKLYFIVFFIFLNMLGLSQELQYVFHEPHLINSDEYENITAIGNDGLGNIYLAGDNSKIYKYDGEEWLSLIFPRNGGNIVEEITGNNKGDLFLAIKDKGLLLLDSLGWKSIDHNNSDYPENPHHGGMQWDEENGVLWIGTNKGLVKFENDSVRIYNHINVPGMVDDQINDMVIGTDKDLWMISNFSTLIHFKNQTFNINPVGWNAELYDLVFDEIDIRSDGILTIASSNYGLIETDGEDFDFLTYNDHGFSHLAVDKNDNIWLADQSDVITYINDSFKTIADSYFPEFINKIFVSQDNHLWVVGNNAPVIELIIKFPDNQIEVSNNNELIVYPVPVISGNEIFVKMANNRKLDKIAIYDVNGNSLYSGTKTDRLKIDLNPGIYFIKFRYGKKIGFKKIVVCTSIFN